MICDSIVVALFRNRTECNQLNPSRSNSLVSNEKPRPNMHPNLITRVHNKLIYETHAHNTHLPVFYKK